MATPNWVNRTIFTGDNLYVMRGMNSESVDLIYADPPFNSNMEYAAPVGSEAAGAAFRDAWSLSDVDQAWHGQLLETNEALYHVIHASRYSHGERMMSYLCMMAVRLLEMRRLLKPSGALYLHCNSHASHYLKLLLDVIFGQENFRNEIVWHYPDNLQGNVKRFANNVNSIFFYAGEGYTFNHVHIPLDKPKKRGGRVWSKELGKVVPERDLEGNPVYRTYSTKKADNVWTIGQSSVTNPDSAEYTGYPTQKPLAVLERIIKASSNEGDMVLDPFAGCATTLIAAQAEGRQWVGIDLSPKAVDLVVERIEGLSVTATDITARADIPERSDLAQVPAAITRKQWLYGVQNGDCKGCRNHFPSQNLTVDHINPVSKGGTDHDGNLQLLCGHCNSLKGDRPMEYLISRLATVHARTSIYQTMLLDR